MGAAAVAAVEEADAERGATRSPKAAACQRPPPIAPLVAAPAIVVVEFAVVAVAVGIGFALLLPVPGVERRLVWL